MITRIDIIQQSTPDQEGYLDLIECFDELDKSVYISRCGSTPNPRSPKTGARWDTCYAWIAAGHDYGWRVYHSPSKGKVLLLNNGGNVVTVNPNPNQNGEHYAEYVEIHEGDSPSWRGSMACITLPPAAWSRFIDMFDNKAEGTIYIKKQEKVA